MYGNAAPMTILCFGILLVWRKSKDIKAGEIRVWLNVGRSQKLQLCNAVVSGFLTWRCLLRFPWRCPYYGMEVSFKIFLRNFSRLILGRGVIMRKIARDPCFYHGIPKGQITGRK